MGEGTKRDASLPLGRVISAQRCRPRVSELMDGDGDQKAGNGNR